MRGSLRTSDDSTLLRSRARLIDRLDRLTKTALDTMAELLNSEQDSVRLGAAKDVLDRALGKARQHIEVKGTDIGRAHLDALVELAARGAQAIDRDSKLIDVTPAAAIEILDDTGLDQSNLSDQTQDE
jgi:hypothetical protein